MEHSPPFFAVEEQDGVLIITPEADMGVLNVERLDPGMNDVLSLLNQSPVKNILVDFHKTEYFGSTALGFFVRLWKTISTRGGRMAFCNLSENEKEILKITRLDSLWDICPSKEKALQIVRSA